MGGLLASAAPPPAEDEVRRKVDSLSGLGLFGVDGLAKAGEAGSVDIWPSAWSGTDDKALVNFASAAAKAAAGSVTKNNAPASASAARRSDERVDIVGIGDERAIEKAARLRNIVRGPTLIEPSQTLKIEVHRVGVRGLFRASRLGGDELGVQRARQPRDDFVLHVEEIGERLVEPLGPEMIAGFGVDELDVDAHAVSAALDAALQHIADVQLAADLLQIDGLPL